MIFIYTINKFGGYCKFRNKYFKTKSKLIKKIFTFLLNGFQYETNSYLPFQTKINGTVNFLHGVFGIFISDAAIIGKNCTIYHQVTIGSNMLIDSNKMGSPTIGNNCLIGAGAKIIGKITIGNNCRIGANAVVVNDLPDDSLIICANQKVIQKENLQNHIYQLTDAGWGYRENGKFVKCQNSEYLKKVEKLGF